MKMSSRKVKNTKQNKMQNFIPRKHSTLLFKYSKLY